MKLRFFYSVILLLLPIICPIARAQCLQQFYDGFESGAFGPQWFSGTNTFTESINTMAPAVGSYSFDATYPGAGSFYQGKYAIFTPGQPNYLSWRIKTNSTSNTTGYLVAGDANIGADNGVLFAYCNNTGNLRFFNTGGYNYPITADTWYFVEARDIDWVNRDMDIWINGALVLTNWAFRSGTATTIDRIHTHSLSGPSIASYDEIIVGFQGVTITNTTITDAVCFADTNGAIDIEASSPNGIDTYGWSNGAITQDISGLMAANYIVTVTDSLGCTVVDSFTVNQPAVIAGNGVVTDITCNGIGDGMIDLSPAGGNAGYSFSWSNGAVTEDLTLLLPGNYLVTITDSLGCMNTDSFSVSEPLAIGISAVITQPGCNGDSTGAIDVTLSNGNPGFTYSWSNGATTEDLSNIAAGNFVLIVTDTTGCVATDTVLVQEPAPIALSFTVTDVLCNGQANGSIDLNPSGGTPGFIYLWSNAASTEDISGISPGTYVVTVTDSMNCIIIDSATVNEPAPIALGFTVTNVLCNGQANGSIDLNPSGGTPGFIYLWSNTESTEDISGISAGTYVVTVTDSMNCTITDSATVNEPPAFSSSGIVTDDVGGAGTGAVDLTVNGGTMGYTFLWSNSETTEDISGLFSGTYIVTITDANGCTLIDTFQVQLIIELSDAVSNFPIVVYPSPFTENFSIDLSQIGNAFADLKLYDLQGRVFWSLKDCPTHAGPIEVNLRLSVGMYLLKVEAGGSSAVMRLVKQ